MRIPKVYLAKSNRANPDLVSKVRQTLSLFNLEIVEFTGGEYSHKELLKCEYLVIVPDLNNATYNNHGDIKIGVGKGLYEQFTIFEDKNDGDENILVISESNMFLKRIAEYGTTDELDYINYGEIILDDYDNNPETLANFFKRFGVKKDFTPEKNKFYVLIRKK